MTLATPAGLGLSDLADQSGCALVQADTEAERLAEAARVCREDRVLVVKAGVAPDPGLIEELDVFVHRMPAGAALVLRSPATLFHTAFPARAPVAAILTGRDKVRDGRSFRRLAKAARRRGTLLRTRARPIG